MQRCVMVKHGAGTNPAQGAAVTDRNASRPLNRHPVRYHVLDVEGHKLEVARIGTTLASDLSSSGLFLSYARLTPGVYVHFNFELPGGNVEAVGKVVHNQHRMDDHGVARPGAGVRFTSMSDGDRQRLEAYLGGQGAGHRFSEARV
jgi:hypothetical protein